MERNDRLYVVMLARNKDEGDSCKTERTSIRQVSHICQLLFPESSERQRRQKQGGDEKKRTKNPRTKNRKVQTSQCDDTKNDGAAEEEEEEELADVYGDGGAGKSTEIHPTSKWKIVIAIGPISTLARANDICNQWKDSHRGVIQKAARGEALSIVHGVQGYVDWSVVFGIRTDIRETHDIVVCCDPHLKDVSEEETDVKCEKHVPVPVARQKRAPYKKRSASDKEEIKRRKNRLTSME